MNETPDQIDAELAALQKKAADEVDINQYRNRFRLLKAVGFGALGAGLVGLVLVMFDDQRNPCERVRDYVCKKDGAASVNCTMYQNIFDESVHDSAQMRQNLRAQCATKIQRLKEDDGVTVK